MDISGWELGATYVTRSSPRLQDTVLSAQTDIAWSDRWGQHVPSGWMGEYVTVRRRDLSHDCGDPTCTDREVTHCTSFDPTKWTLVRRDGDGGEGG